MRCNKCGKEFEGQAKCPHCGFPAGVSYNAGNLQNLANGQAPTSVKTVKKGLKGWHIALIVVGSIIVIGVIGTAIGGGNSNKTVDVDTSNVSVSSSKSSESNEKEAPKDSITKDYLTIYENADDYIDKNVRFSGPIGSISGESIIISEGFSGLNRISIELSSSTEDLKDDEYVTIVGRVDKKVLGFLYIKEAQIIATGNEAKENYNAEIKAKEKEKQEDKQQFINECQNYNYEDISRNPNEYKDKKAKFEGQVIQVQENGNNIVLRVNVTKTENEFADGGYLWDDTIYVEYTRQEENESRILEDDIIHIYGKLNGVKSYKSVLGDEITIPLVEASYVDITE